MQNTLIVYEDNRCEDLVLMHWLRQSYNNFKFNLIDKLTDNFHNSLVIADYDLPIPKEYNHKILQYKDLDGADFSYEHLFSVLEGIISNHNIKVIYMHSALLYSQQKDPNQMSIGSNAKNIQKLMTFVKQKKVALITANQVRQSIMPTANSSPLTRVSTGLVAMADEIYDAKFVKGDVAVTTLKNRMPKPESEMTFTIKRLDVRKEQVKLRMKKEFS